MITVARQARILIASRPVDFRRGMDGLAATVQQVLQENPYAGDVFIFRAKRNDVGPAIRTRALFSYAA
jgi:transposase